MGFWDDVKEQIDGQKDRSDIDIDEKVKKTAEAIKEYYMREIQFTLKSSEERGDERIKTISYSHFLVLGNPWVTVARENNDRYYNYIVDKVTTNKIAFEFNTKLNDYLRRDRIIVGELQKACLRYDSYDTPCFTIDNGIFLYSLKDIRILERLSIYSDIKIHYIRGKKYETVIYQNNKRIYSSSNGAIGGSTGMTISFCYPN